MKVGIRLFRAVTGRLRDVTQDGVALGDIVPRSDILSRRQDALFSKRRSEVTTSSTVRMYGFRLPSRVSNGSPMSLVQYEVRATILCSTRKVHSNGRTCIANSCSGLNFSRKDRLEAALGVRASMFNGDGSMPETSSTPRLLVQ